MTKNKFNNKFSNLESSENTKKYVKEMYDLAEKHEKRSFMSFVAIGIPIAVILLFVVIQMISFSVHSSKDNQLASKSHPTNTTDVKKDLAKATKKSDAKATKIAPAAPALVNQLNDRLFNYLNASEKRTNSYSRAKQLNSNSEKGLSSIYIAQILRDNGYKIDKSVINASHLVQTLKKDGWKTISDYKQLKKGDICFTTSSKPSGPPAHTYVFMGWVQQGKTDYAYVVDSQVAEYKNTYHKRNIDFTTPKKEKFAFFMRK